MDHRRINGYTHTHIDIDQDWQPSDPFAEHHQNDKDSHNGTQARRTQIPPRMGPESSVSPESSESSESPESPESPVSSVCQSDVDDGSDEYVPLFLQAVFDAAKTKKPPEANAYYLPGMKLLVALCAELQLASKDKTFFLSCRHAGILIGQPFRTASRWLRRLEADGILILVNAGGMKGRKANEYRFCTPPF